MTGNIINFDAERDYRAMIEQFRLAFEGRHPIDKHADELFSRIMDVIDDYEFELYPHDPEKADEQANKEADIFRCITWLAIARYIGNALAAGADPKDFTLVKMNLDLMWKEVDNYPDGPRFVLPWGL